MVSDVLRGLFRGWFRRVLFPTTRDHCDGEAGFALDYSLLSPSWATLSCRGPPGRVPLFSARLRINSQMQGCHVHPCWGTEEWGLHLAVGLFGLTGVVGAVPTKDPLSLEVRLLQVSGSVRGGPWDAWGACREVRS